ncbi:hypothetical protein [Streptomyces sp. NPDC088762]|uniref:hypothetical protein n=1 Tax=Streptomyces sp. NPDC088762 TaxID=3365891 RepID=UPI0037FF23C6
MPSRSNRSTLTAVSVAVAVCAAAVATTGCGRADTPASSGTAAAAAHEAPTATQAPSSPAGAPPTSAPPPAKEPASPKPDEKTASKGEGGTGSKAGKGGGVVVAALEAEQVEPAQLPDNAQQKWKELGPALTQPLTQDFQLNECVSVPGATNWRQQAFISSHKTPAIQNSLSFKDEAAAKAGYQKVLDGMNSCAQTSQALQKQYRLTPDAAVSPTASIDNGRAWSRRWDAVQGISAAGPQTNHIYVVQRGAVLTLLSFDEWDSAAPASYDPRSDASVLAMLAG